MILQSSSKQLRCFQSLSRRPIPLDSTSSTFIKSLNRRLSTANFELNFLDSRSFGTVSFEELLGHCNQIYKNNQEDLLHLQNHFGYVPVAEWMEKSSLSKRLPCTTARLEFGALMLNEGV